MMSSNRRNQSLLPDLSPVTRTTEIKTSSKTALILGSKSIQSVFAENGSGSNVVAKKLLPPGLTIPISATCPPDRLKAPLCHRRSNLRAPRPLQHEVSLASYRRRISYPIARAYTRTSAEVMASASAFSIDGIVVVRAANHLSFRSCTVHPSSPRTTSASFEHPTPSFPGHVLPVIVPCQGSIAPWLVGIHSASR